MGSAKSASAGEEPSVARSRFWCYIGEQGGTAMGNGEKKQRKRQRADMIAPDLPLDRAAALSEEIESEKA